MISFGLVFLYILVEFLLDKVLKFDFRRRWSTHAPYIVLEYIALYSLIHIAFDIDRTWGYLVSISFWILLASLIYVYWDQIKLRKKRKIILATGQFDVIGRNKVEFGQKVH